MAAVVWFRNDLRLTDHPALQGAIATGQPVLPLYIHDKNCSRALGGAAQWWLHHSLASLRQGLKDCGVDLILRRGDAFEVFKDIHTKVGISHIFWHDRYDQEGQRQDQAITDYFKTQNIDCQSFNGSLLFDSAAFKNKEEKIFKVFSPFWKHCLKHDTLSEALDRPTSIIAFTETDVISDDLDSWQLLPTQPDWSQGFYDTWQPGEEGAQSLVDEFLTSKLSRYKSERDQPAALAISDLSAPLHWGEISVKQLWHRVRQTAVIDNCEPSAECFLKELGWREFSYYTLVHNPQMVTEPLRADFKDFPWQYDASLFKAWTTGQTGYPLVDAGMRQLWQTGYMHNRVRLVTASFLVKDLLQPWQRGEQWFWNTLVDADLASNPFNWQWVTGCGTDASPYFRIFNPIFQSKKFDPQGEYIKYWIPELRDVEDHLIHEPWLLKNKVENYPDRIVDHYEVRGKNLQIFQDVLRKQDKEGAQNKPLAEAV